MSLILLDTHVWSWSIYAVERLSPRAVAAFAGAETIYVSPISFYEIALKAEAGKWPEMLPILDQLTALALRQGGVIAPLNAEICLAAGRMDCPHRDPFDRLIAATAQHLGVSVITKDRALAGMAGIECIW